MQGFIQPTAGNGSRSHLGFSPRKAGLSCHPITQSISVFGLLHASSRPCSDSPQRLYFDDALPRASSPTLWALWRCHQSDYSPFLPRMGMIVHAPSELMTHFVDRSRGCGVPVIAVNLDDSSWTVTPFIARRKRNVVRWNLESDCYSSVLG
jgi:hypothetical protein